MRLATLAWRGLTARRLRTALTVIGVALGVALVSGTLLANQAASEAVERAAHEIIGKADLRVRAFDPAGFTPRTVQLLRKISIAVLETSAVSERRIDTSTLPGPNEIVFDPLLALGVDPAEEQMVRTYDLEAGTFLRPDHPEDVLLNAAWASA